MPLTQYAIAGSLRDALDTGPLTDNKATVLFVPYGSHDSRVEDSNVLLGSLPPITITDLPSSYLLDEGLWTVRISTTTKVPGAGGRLAFDPIVVNFTHDGPTTWAEIVAGEVTPIPLSPTIPQQVDAQLDTLLPSKVSNASDPVGAALSATYVARPELQTNLAFKPGDWNRTPGTQGSYGVLGIDTTLDMPYCRDDGNGVLRLCTAVDSQNRPTTWSTSKGIPTGTTWSSAIKILTFKGKLYLLTKQDSSGLPAIYSAAPTTGNTTLTWDAAPLVVGTAGSTGRASCFTTDGAYLYYGDYGDPTGGPRLFRSSDGTTWTTVQTFTGIRHIHAVKPDPYNLGHVWIAMGDGVSGPNRYSTDSGSTFTATPLVHGASIQVTDFGFTATDVWGTDDTAYITAATISKATKEWAGASASFHGSTPHPAPRSNNTFYDGVTNGTTTFTSATAGFVSSTTPFVPTDVGAKVKGPGIPAGATVASVTNGTTIVLSAAATTTATAVPFTIERRAQTFAPAVFYGDMDATNGVFYMTTEQSTIYPDGALFAMFGKGSRPTLVDYGPIGNSPVYLWRNRVFYGPFNRPVIEFKRTP